MKVLFWLNMGLDRHSTSGHLLMAVISQVRKLGNEVHVLMKDTSGNEKQYIEYLEKIGVSQNGVYFSAPKKSHFAERYLAEASYIYKSGKYVTEDYNAIFIQSNIVAGLSVKIAKRKCPKARIIYNVQDVYPQNVYYSGKVGKLNPAYLAMLEVQKYAYKKADQIITISEDMRDLLVEAGAEESKISVIYNWSYQDELISENNISPIIAKMFDKRFFNVVYAGNIGLFQNVDIILDAALKLYKNDDVWFHIFGDGLYKENLKKRAAKEGIKNITFHPIQPHELAPSIYASASVNLIPLGFNQYRTALPSKTATCLACQKPIIFSIGESSKFGKRIKEQTGCPVLNCTDSAALAKSIIDIKEKKFSINTGDFFLQNCSITKNSLAYAKLIVGKVLD